jgi:hypothetical protein
MDYLERSCKRLGGIGVAEELQNFFEHNGTSLSDIQKEILTYRWEDSDLVMFSYNVEKKEIKTKPWIRLTIPFYFIFAMLVVLIIRPVKWLITGSKFWKYENKFEQFIGKWRDSLFK